jgi:ADP-ribose pyrophosphatase YjhB (NUDIX family)
VVALDPSFCPTCGTELTSRHVDGRDRNYCPSCDRVVWRNPVPTAGVAVVDVAEETDPAILFVRRIHPPDAGEWGVPAGFVEHDERAVDAAARELAEETGLTVDPAALELVAVDDLAHPSGRSLVTVCYAVARDRTTGDPVAGSDAAAARFWTLDELSAAGETLRDLDRERVPRAVDRVRSARDV